MIMYRYETILLCSGRVKLDLNHFHVLRQTKCGVWIFSSYGKKKFINLSTVKKWAYPTPEEAFQGFMARKRRQVAILKSQLHVAEASLKLTLENDTVETEGFDCYEL